MENYTVLVIDDDKNILKILELYLKKEGFNVATCESGALAKEKFLEVQPALVVLDVMLPGKDGFHVLADIREVSDVPVIMLTAKGSTQDRVLGLDGGADDYIAKPFDAKELLARIKAVLRRFAATQESGSDMKSAISFHGLQVSIEHYSVTINGTKIEMTPKEIELLYYLASHERKVFTREQLLEAVWGFEFYGDTRTVDVHVKRIREKLGAEYATLLGTIWGVGYKFDSQMFGKKEE
ncbi:MAG: response regulator transcription factor [Clostridiales bacterium]|jgi:DNA-binding response OmpR family regulator|nr:response regulator transcription factor [Clostridiales bacterium]